MNPDEVERYSLGDFSEAEAAPFDEHLLVCEVCRKNVEASDAYVAAMRAAGSQIRQKTDKSHLRSRSCAKLRAAAGRSG
jgi:hypothetical protein